jgi:hypothetical protein
MWISAYFWWITLWITKVIYVHLPSLMRAFTTPFLSKVRAFTTPYSVKSACIYHPNLYVLYL